MALNYYPKLTKKNEIYFKEVPIPRQGKGCRIKVNTNIDINLNRLPTVPYSQFVTMLEQSGEAEVAAFSPDPTIDLPPNCKVVETTGQHNLLALAVHRAFYEHYPLRLTPDCIWYTIMQGLSLHLEKNPAISRRCFPKRKTKYKIRVDKQQSVRKIKHETSATSNMKTNWKVYQNQIYTQMKDSGGKFGNLASQSFSTTTTASRLAFRTATMGRLKHFFRLKESQGCGIPFIELYGDPKDWTKLRKQARALFEIKGIELDWWKKPLITVVTALAEAANGYPYAPFFASVCTLFSSTGKDKPISGWLQSFFPYLVEGPLDMAIKRNEMIDNWRQCFEKYNDCNDKRAMRVLFGEEPAEDLERDCGEGVHLENIPNSLSAVKFDLVSIKQFEGRDGLLYERETREKYTLASGLVAIVQYPKTRALEPVFGWGILRSLEVNSSRRSKD